MSYTAAVITISDKGAAGLREDTSGPALCEILKTQGYEVVYTNMIPDEMEQIKKELILCSDEKNIHLILTTGGTGFAKRDITPEATLAVLERETRGIPEAMRAESMKITDRGCLSRSVAGIRGNSLIINLPGSKKASTENLNAVLSPVEHGLKMLGTEGSADCAEAFHKEIPSMDEWKREAKLVKDADKIGMYLVHNGVVRKTPRALVRGNESDAKDVSGMLFSYDQDKVNQAIQRTLQREGIYYARVWLNSGKLAVGDDIMYVMIGGDIRPHVIEALQDLVGEIKSNCVEEKEL